MHFWEADHRRSDRRDRPRKAPRRPCTVGAMITLELELEIAGPIEEVFAFLADWEALPTWQPEFLEVARTTPGPLGIGTMFSYVRRVPFGRQRGTMEITDFAPPHRVAGRADGGPILPSFSWELTEREAGRTHVRDRLTAEVRAPLSLLTPVLRRQFAREGMRHLMEAKRRVESPAG
jgi:uncharacterized protein YndB with AHSA1/START domain